MKIKHIVNILTQLGTIIIINILFSLAPKIAFASLSVLVFFNYTYILDFIFLLKKLLKPIEENDSNTTRL